MSRKTRTWVPLPLTPAPAWWKLSALHRTIGQFLYAQGFGEEPGRPVLGIELAQVPGRHGPEYPQVESWACGLASAIGDERKTFRAAVRAMVQHGLLVAVPGGVLLLYRSEDYAKHHADPALTDPSPGDDRPPTDTSPGADQTLTDPSPDPDRPLTDPSPSQKSAESQGPKSHREREREKEREIHNAEELVREGYSARFHAAHGVRPSWDAFAQPRSKEAKSLRKLSRWVLGIADGELAANCDRLLAGFFANKWASSEDVRHAFSALAKSPERYWPSSSNGSGGRVGNGGGYMSASSNYGPSTDLNQLGPLPPMLFGAAE